MSGRLEGKHCLVTGGSKGIGAAISRRFVAEGGRVILASRGADAGRALADELGPGATWVELDVTDADRWASLAASLDDDPVDVLVNNAGELLNPVRLHELEPEAFRHEIDLNLTGAFLGMRYLLPSMLARGGGSIINIGSISGVRAQDDAPAYQAAKGGLRLLTRNAAFTYAREGIRVNTVNPGAIITPKTETDDLGRLPAFLARTPMGRRGLADEVAAVVLFLASDESSYVTGSDYDVDGGYLL
jgi:NAD(P)-dependent dehydrogenase (short-subunit alcohol dehydrogenase family)